MKLQAIGRCFSSLVLSTLGACSGPAATAPSEIGISNQTFTSVARWAAPSRPDSRKSWISPRLASAKSPLLFVSDSGTADVYIYKLQTLEVLAAITGFSQPQGECSDNKGNVWITDTNAKTVYELSRKGNLENKISVSQGYPDGCAWDSTTDNLAVMLLFAESGASGAVLVYRKGGAGGATQYTNSKQYYYNFGGYDGGNLFFDGRDASGTFMLSELAKGAKSAKTLPISGGTVYFPGMVEWDSSSDDLIVGDQACDNTYTSCLYAVKVTSKGGTITGTINLQGYSGSQVCDLVQGVEFNGQIAGSDNDFCGSLPSTTYVWPYPAGGPPTAYNSKTDSTPVGAAISQ